MKPLLDNNIFKQHIANLLPEFQLDAKPVTGNSEAFTKTLSQQIDHLINTDFSKLINILYRLDIAESKLKNSLQNSEMPAGEIIAEMIIERELQKIETRKSDIGKDDIPDNEKW